MELAGRMSKTVEGQVTWAEPDLGKKCWECAHCRPVEHGKYVCLLVKLVSGWKGKPYDGKRAIACGKFSAAVDGQGQSA